MGMYNLYRIIRNEIVTGRSFPVLVVDRTDFRDNHYKLTNLEVYRNGKIICPDICDEHPWDDREMRLKPEMSLESLEWAIERGEIVTTVPPGATISISGLAECTISKMDSVLEGRDVLAMVRDTLDEYGGRPTSSERCREAFLKFLWEPTKENQERLRRAYEEVPPHWRIPLLHDYDNGDTAICLILLREIADIDKDWLEDQRQLYANLDVKEK